MNEDFGSWLNSKGIGGRYKTTLITDARRIDREYGNLDEAFEKDGFASVLETLQYTASDERAGRPNPSKLRPRKGVLLTTLLSAYRQALERYADFRRSAGDTANGPSELPPEPTAPPDSTRLEAALAKVSGEHLLALRWFLDHSGQQVTWGSIQSFSEAGPRLVTQAKGIYKPAYADYALSVRQTLDSPYADKEIIRRDDGSWVFPYFQENPEPQHRDREATNRGLMNCMRDAIPVGVLHQSKPKPGVEYEVLGLAAVTEWNNGYFFLEGYSRGGTLKLISRGDDTAYELAKASVSLNEFQVQEGYDTRQKQIAEIVRRRGQEKFRRALIAAYGGKCVVTGCNAVDALEAAHIFPYKGEFSDNPRNGLLLRADIHSLFDLGLLAIHPNNKTVLLADVLLKTQYSELAGRPLSEPLDKSLEPAREALKWHLKSSRINVGQVEKGSS